jgi:hypothetical protein
MGAQGQTEFFTTYWEGTLFGDDCRRECCVGTQPNTIARASSRQWMARFAIDCSLHTKCFPSFFNRAHCAAEIRTPEIGTQKALGAVPAKVRESQVLVKVNSRR